MHHPILKSGHSSSSATLTVPCADGGIDRVTAPYRLADNQLADAENVWYADGLLRTRPGTVTTESLAAAYNSTADYRAQQTDGAAVKYTVIPAGTGKIFVSAYELTAGGSARLIAAAVLTASGSDGRLFRHAGAWHILLDSGTLLRESGGAWAVASPYVPTVMSGGTPVSYADRYLAASGKPGEAPNLLTAARECRFTSDGAYDAPAAEDNRHVVFKLPMPFDGDAPLTAAVTYVDHSGSDPVIRTWRYPQDAGQVFASGVFLLDDVPAASGYWSSYRDAQITLDDDPDAGYVRIGIRLHNVVGGLDVYKYQPLPYVSDNNVSIAFRAAGGSRAAEIGGMSRATWYGGDRGTRLFLTGHPASPNLVRWSAVNDPYYWPETNAAFVGDSSEPVTAFGKQGDLLVMFKPREIYSASSAADGTAGEAGRLPITPISAVTGCDCPDSVRLVNNRLVWAHTDGQVYALASVGTLSEKNVRCLSARIGRLTLGADCSAGEYHRHYVLASGEDVWLLNTDTPAFLSSRTASEDEANRRLAWWRWVLPLPDEPEMLVSDGSTLSLCLPTVEREGSFVHRQVTLSEDAANADEVAFSVTGKPWDFGHPDRRKAVRQAVLFVAAGQGARVRCDYVTDTAAREDADALTATGEESVWRLTPNVNRARTFGLRLRGVGRFALGEMRVRYALQGNVR